METNIKKTEIFKNTEGEFEWRARAGNNKIVASSGRQGYTTLQAASQATWDIFPNVLGHRDYVTEDD